MPFVSEFPNIPYTINPNLPTKDNSVVYIDTSRPNPTQALDLLEDLLNGRDLSKEELVVWHLYLARSQSTAQERKEALAFSASIGKVPPPKISPTYLF